MYFIEKFMNNDNYVKLSFDVYAIFYTYKISIANNLLY